MPKNNLKLNKKNISKSSAKKSSASHLSAKNTKSETLVIARESRLRRGDRSNLRDSSGLLRFARNDKSAEAWNFKSWHKVSAAVLSLGIIAVVVFQVIKSDAIKL